MQPRAAGSIHDGALARQFGVVASESGYARRRLDETRRRAHPVDDLDTRTPSETVSVHHGIVEMSEDETQRVTDTEGPAIAAEVRTPAARTAGCMVVHIRILAHDRSERYAL